MRIGYRYAYGVKNKTESLGFRSGVLRGGRFGWYRGFYYRSAMRNSLNARSMVSENIGFRL